MRFYLWKLNILANCILRIFGSSIPSQPIEQSPNLNSTTSNEKASKTFFLENGLKVLIINDDENPHDSVSLNVRVGSLNDPKEFQGLAHLIEHMTLSSDSNSFKNFLCTHGGKSFGSTFDANTNYAFGIKSEFILGALEKFSVIFNCTTISQESIDREIGAVHQEFISGLQNEKVKNLEIIRNKASPKHPFHGFASGNKESLKAVTATHIKEFIKKYYTADRMCLVICSKKPIDEIERSVCGLFGSLPKGNLLEIEITESMFLRESLKTISFFNTHHLEKQLRMHWFFPSEYDGLRDLSLYPHIQLENYMPDSLLFQLKKADLISKMVTERVFNGNQITLVINFTLTSLGEKEYKKIIQIVFAFLRALQSRPIDLQVLQDEQEIRRYTALNYPQYFNLKKTKILSTRRHHLPDSMLLDECYFETKDSEGIKAAVDFLTPDNVLVIMETSEMQFLNGKFVTKYSGVEYWTEKLEDLNVDCKFSFVEKNPVIPKKFAIKTEPDDNFNLDEAPKMLVEKGLWYKRHYSNFTKPLGKICILLSRPNFFIQNVRNYSLTLLLIRYFEKIYAPEFYYFQNSKYSVVISVLESGIEFKFFGIDDKLYELVDTYMKRFVKFLMSDEYEQIFKGDLSKFNYVEKSEDAISIMEELIRHVLKIVPFTTKEINNSEVRNLNSMNEFRKELLTKSFNLRMLVLGNFYQKEALDAYIGVKEIIKEIVTDNIVDTLSNSHLIIDPLNPLSICFTSTLSFNMISVLYQCPFSPRDKRNILFSVLYCELFSKGFCQDLRDKRKIAENLQLNYKIVRNFSRIQFIVQSENQHCNYVEEKILNFIELSYKIISEPHFGERFFNPHKLSLMTQFKNGTFNKPKYCDSYWDKIINPDNITLTSQECAVILANLTIDEFIKFVDQYLLPTGKERRKASLWVIGKERMVEDDSMMDICTSQSTIRK